MVISFVCLLFFSTFSFLCDFKLLTCRYQFLNIKGNKNKKAFLEEKGLKCSLYDLVNQDSYY